MFSCEISTIFMNTYFEEHYLIAVSGALYLNQIWFKSDKDWLEKDAISAGPKLDFLPHPTNPHPLKIEAPPKNKI